MSDGRRLDERGLARAELARYMKLARLERGLTQRQLADLSGIDKTVLSRIEAGSRWPSVPQLLHLARCLEISLQRYLTGRDFPGPYLNDIAIELQRLGVVDLFVPGARVPGAFRRAEEVVALAVAGESPEPRVVEAIPAVLAWNRLDAPLLQLFGRRFDPRTTSRLAWLADVTLSIHQAYEFPGGVVSEGHLKALTNAVKPAEEDGLGFPSRGPHSPIWKRWNITYGSRLAEFRARAEQLWGARRQRGDPHEAPGWEDR